MDTDLLNLCAALHDQEATTLQNKINAFLQKRTDAQVAFLTVVLLQEEQLLVNAVGERTLGNELRMPLAGHAFGAAVLDRRPRKLHDFLDGNVNQLQELLGLELKSLLCVPVTSPLTDGVALIATVVNSNGDDFDEKDVDTINLCFRHTLGILLNTLAYEEEKRLRKECQSLLSVAQNLFSHLGDVTVLLKEVMTEARNLTKAERCSLFLVDRERNELVAKVFDGNVTDTDAEVVSTTVELRIPITQGIVGHVACTGELLNIRDTYSHPLFYKGIDESTGFKTRNILCFPITNNDELVGVAELCNKIGAPAFNRFDEEIATAFSIYCGLSIMHSLLYRKVADAQYRSKLSNELMMYHMKVFTEDVIKLTESAIKKPEEMHLDFHKFSFSPRLIPEQDTVMAIISMVEDLGFLSRYHIRRETLAKFVLMVCKGYRNPPYHNWMHAFSVTHFCYLLLKNLALISDAYLTDLEGFSLLVACMCHDLDHRGTNNSFQLKSNSVLAALYSSEGSVMERHHFSQAVCILNSEGCNVLEHLSSKDYTACLDYIRYIILATDLAHHLRIVKDLQQMASDGYNKEDSSHHNLLLCLLMTSCDLSDQTKDWKCSKKVADLVYQEFFSQGDLEKAMGKRPPDMMDRERAFIPALQLQFFSDIVIPVYEILASLFPAAQEPYTAVCENRALWQRAQDIILARKGQMNVSLEVLDDEAIEREVLGKTST